MIFFNRSAKERELITKYHQCYEQYIKKYENYKTLHKNVLRIENRFQDQIDILERKRRSLHDANMSILKTKNTIYMIAYPKEMSPEEYRNYWLYIEYNSKIKTLKEKLEKGYEIVSNYDEKEPTTYMFTFQTSSQNQSFKIYSLTDKQQMREEIKMLEDKIQQFTPDQINFFDNKLGWERDIEKRLKRLVQFQDEHTNIRDSLFSHINDMRETKKDLVVAKKDMETYYNENLKNDKVVLNKLYSSFSKNTKKEFEKRQSSINKEDFSM